MNTMALDALSDLRVAAFGRSLDEELDPACFRVLGSQAQRLVPHDRVIIPRREGDGDTRFGPRRCACGSSGDGVLG